MSDGVFRRNAAAYVCTTWEDVLSSEEHVVTARVTTQKNAPPFTLPIGAKLTLAVVEPDTRHTREAAVKLSVAHQATASHTSKGRVYVGLSNYAIPVNYITPATALANNVYYPTLEQVKPVGTSEPLNFRMEYKHMQPSLTAGQGRSFGDLSTPLWIDAWQSDTVGVVPDPDYQVYNRMTSSWENVPTKVGAHISFMFYRFAQDIVLRSFMGLDDGTPTQDATHFRGPLKLKIYLEYLLTPDYSWQSV